MSEYIKEVKSGITFYTHKKTGESGLTQTGISKSLGVAQSSINRVLSMVSKAPMRKNLPESLQPLWGKDLELCFKHKNAKIYTSDVWACLADYYAHDAKKTTKEALSVCRSFNRIGAESYIQGITKWLPEKYQTSLEARYRILEVPDPYEALYSKKMCDKIAGWFFAPKFYWDFFYQWMTPEERKA